MDEKQYAERDIMGLDKEGRHYSRHLSAMTGEDLHDKSDIAAELAYRDAKIAKLQAQVDVRDHMLSEKNSRYNRVRADRNRVQRERDAALLALRDVTRPLARLKREAEAEGNVLNGQAHTIAYDPHHLQSIAKEALEGVPTDILNLLTAQIRTREISDLIDEIGSDLDAVHVVVMLRERLAKARNVMIMRDTSDLETEIEAVRQEERTAAGKQLALLFRLYAKNCKYISEESVRDILETLTPEASSALEEPQD